MQTSPQYKSLDYEFGTLIQSYRRKAKLTQPELAGLVGVTKRSVLNWEAGISYPQINHLRKALEIFVNKGCFTLHEEASEAEFFWEKATRTKNDDKDAFNRDWFNGLLHEHEHENEQPGPARPRSIRQPLHFQDWSEAVDNRVLYGRERELADLENWVIKEKQQVVSIFGMGGMGKTSLAVSLTHQVASHFEFVIFRTLRNAPPLDELLDGLLRFLLQGHLTRLPALQSEKLALVMNYLRQHRCLLVLDNLESIMQDKLGAGEYREGYTDYAEFIRRVSEFTHKSCVLITSREKPHLLGFYEEKNGAVRSLALRGLDKKSCQAILKSMNIGSAEEYGQALTERYAGNPLALMLIAEPIRRIYGGHTGAFLASPGSSSGGLDYVLNQHFERLSEVELDILYWLALSREPLDLETIQARSVLQAGPKTYRNGITALLNRFLLEQTEDGSGFTLQGVIIEYVTENLIGRFYDELMAPTPEPVLLLLCRYPLLQTYSREYIRQAQLRLIIDPLLFQLGAALKRTGLVTRHLKSLLEVVGQLPQPKQAYAGGNLLNMLVRLGSDLTGWSFENLSLWQAHLAGVELHGLNLTGADLTGATFTESQISAYSLAYSPDGKTLAAGCFNGSIKVWEVGKMFGRQLLECRGHTNVVASVAISPDGKILASGSADGTVRLWELQSGLCLAVLEGEGPTAVFRTVAFSPDGKILAGGGNDNHIYVWQVSSAHQISSIDAEQGWIMAVAFSPDGKTLASAGFDGTIKLWDASEVTGPLNEKRKEIKNLAVLSGHTSWLYSVAFSPDGKLLASGGGDQTVRLWSVATGNCQHILKARSGIIKVNFSPDGKLIASADRDGIINLWTTANPATSRTLSTGNGSIMDLVFNPDGNFFVTSTAEVSNLTLRSVKTLETLDVLRGFTNTIYRLAINPDGKWLGASGVNSYLHLWNLTGPQPGVPVVLKGHDGLVLGLAFSPGGNFVATTGTDATIKLWNLESKKCWRTLAGPTTIPMAMVFSPDNRLLIAGDNEGNLTMWSLVTGEILGRQPAFLGLIRKLLFSPDGRTLATGAEDSYIKLWEVDAEKGVFRQKAAWPNGSELVMSLAYNRDGSVLFSGDAQGVVRCWKAATGELLASFNAHKDIVWSLDFNSARQILASAGENGLIHLWQVENPASPVLLYTLDHASKLMSMAVNTEGTRLYSGGSGGIVKVWNLESPGLVTTLVPPAPYEKLNITGVTGLTEAQRLNLLSLGAIENPG